MWDWIYDHHRLLVVVLAVAIGDALVVLAWAWRRRSRRLALLCLLPALATAVVLAGWTAADTRSNERDIATRVAQVVQVLPAGMQRIAQSAGDNFRTSTYRLASEPSATVDVLARSVARLAEGDVYGPESAAGRQMVVSFRYRDRGCDGSVEVALTTSRAETGGSVVEISGHCED